MNIDRQRTHTIYLRDGLEKDVIQMMRILIIVWGLSLRCVTERPHDSHHHPIFAYIILHNS